MKLMNEGNGMKYQLLRFTTPYLLDIIFLKCKEVNE
jgi:hypothetical protein